MKNKKVVDDTENTENTPVEPVEKLVENSEVENLRETHSVRPCRNTHIN